MKNNNSLIGIFSFCICLFVSGCGSATSSSAGESANSSRALVGESVETFNSANFPVDLECDVEMPEVFFTFDDEFNLDTSVLLLMASFLTEQEIPLAQEHLAEWGFNRTTIYQDEMLGMRVHISDHNDFLLVAYRGTTMPFEYISNATFIMEDVPEYADGAKMHLGFWHAHSTSRDAVLSEIMAMGGREKPVVFAGHSRGGVMATLQAVYFKRRGGDLPFVYTFAQPRLGNTELRLALDEMLENQYYRIDYFTDITPKVPPSADVAEPLYNEGYIPAGLANLVSDLGYDFDPGEQYILSEGGYLDLVEDQQAVQLEFWRYFFTTYSNLIFSLGDLVQALPENHKISNYLCNMAKLY